MFHVISAMAEFERSLIQERVRAGLRNAVAKGRTLGRPRREVDVRRVESLRASGHSWRQVGELLNVDASIAYRAAGAARSQG